MKILARHLRTEKQFFQSCSYHPSSKIIFGLRMVSDKYLKEKTATEIDGKKFVQKFDDFHENSLS